ncbi:alginate O-acetyltransferase complex protein AlgI [Lachnospiraceae bacterium XPB1003]|nr:alginate O-acetyltransferase complex protein AlgI [Lachnospiraceae bacterium XPB1003]
MVFSSMTFLWLFLPVVFVLCLLIRKPKYQNILLLIFSLFFYAWGMPYYVILLLVSVIINWICGVWMEKWEKGRTVVLIVSIVANLGLLGYFKYANFILNTIDALIPGGNTLPRLNIGLPIGISFFTFQAMSYVIDLYRGEYKAQKNPLNLALYISFFPQLIAGPIVKYRDVNKQIVERTVTGEKIALGFRRFIYGLAKKVIISNILAISVDRIYATDMTRVNSALAWTAAICYTLQIYYDFSGYSDMAIGLGRMFGFDFLENFNYPYISSSIKEFWRRWHISMSSWFREYLYIPLGGNRKGKIRTYINLFIVFAATGLWHGASWNFVGWGLFHGFFIILERLGFGKLLEKSKILSRIYCLLVVIVGWVFFRANDTGTAIEIIKRMFMPWQYNSGNMILGVIMNAKTLLITFIAIIACGPVQQIFKIKALEKVAAKWKNSLPEAIVLALLLFYSITLLANDAYNPFIYFRF